MKETVLGSHLRKVPSIAVGCMRLSEKSKDEMNHFIHSALEQGAYFFDHADIYGSGMSETVFGDAFASDPSLHREDVLIQSKCGIRQGCYDLSKEHILESVDGILKRLQNDYLDLLLLHRPDALVEPEEVAAAFDVESKAQLFGRNVDVYTNAPLVGFLYGRTAEQDDTKNPETNQVYNQNVMGDRVIYSQEELMFNFGLIMLLDKQYEPDEDKRIDKAFRHMGENPADEERFDSYVRGGVDVLYEKLIEGATDPEDYINNLFEFVEEFQDRFNSEVSNDDILQLCIKK